MVMEIGKETGDWKLKTKKKVKNKVNYGLSKIFVQNG